MADRDIHCFAGDRRAVPYPFPGMCDDTLYRGARSGDHACYFRRYFLLKDPVRNDRTGSAMTMMTDTVA